MMPVPSLPVVFAAILDIAVSVLLGAVTSGGRPVSAAHAHSGRAAAGSPSVSFKLCWK
jgi:hypothetical protein